MVDLILTVIPGLIVWQLQNLRLRVSIFALLGLSAVAAVASLVKTVELRLLIKTSDPTWDFVPLAIWFTVENTIVIAVASVPTIRPLFVSYRMKKSSAASQMSQKPIYAKGQSFNPNDSCEDSFTKAWVNRCDGIRNSISGGRCPTSFGERGVIRLNTTISAVSEPSGSIDE